MLRAAGLVVMALTILTVSRADVIQPTVVLPPVSGAYTTGGVCLDALGRCTQNAIVSDFGILSSNVDDGNEIVSVSANYSADIFTNNGGFPGSFLGHLSLSGTAQFTYFGRDPSVNPVGTFITELTDFAFQGMLNGNTFEIKQHPEKTSAGSTTILAVTFDPPIMYGVSGSLEIFAQYSFNESPFMDAPPRTAGLNPAPEAIPEPAFRVLAGTILAGIIGISSRRRQR